MFTNIRYILLTALRDWLFFALIAGIMLGAFISHILGSTALLEPGQMTLSFVASSSRIMLMVSIIVFVCFHIRSAFDSKEIDVLLSRPISRSNLVLSYAFGFMVVATILCLVAIAAVYYSNPLNSNGMLAWSTSLLLEAWLVSVMALFAALTLRSAVFSVLATMGLYALSRMMGFFTATIQKGVVFDDPLITEVTRFTLNTISMVIPRLDFFVKGQWLIYGVSSYNEIYRYALQGSIFIILLIVMAIVDFRRRQF